MEIAALEVILRTDRARRGAKRVQKDINGIGASAAVAQKRVTTSTVAMGGAFARLRGAILSTQALLLALGVGIGLVQTIQTLKEFEFTMAGVRAIAGATANEFLLLEDRARQLGATTIFAASEAAEGMRLLSLAGFEVNETLSAIEGTLNLATAGTLSLGEASQITANIVRSFRLEAAKAGEIADILAKTATNANTSVGGLGNAFSFVGAIARAANQSVADTAASLGVLADAGFDSSRAGTGLRRVMGEILVQSEKLLARLPELGLDFEDINLQTNDLVTVMGRLAPLASDAAFALEVFGQRGGPAFLALVGQADRLDDLALKTRNAGGAAKEIAAILTDTLQGSLKLMRSALEEAILKLGDAGFTGAIRKVADTIRGVITVFNGQAETLGENAAKFEALAEKVRTFGVFLGALGLIFAIKGIVTLTGVVAALTVTLLANPFALWITAIAAVTALLFSFRGTLITVGDQTFSLGAITKEVIGSILSLVRELAMAFGLMGDDSEEAAEEVENSFGTVMSAAILTVADLIDRSVKGLRALLIIAGDIPNIIKNFGVMSDEAFARLQDLENTEGIGERAAKNFAKGFTEELDPKLLAQFEVNLKSIEKQATRLGDQLASLTKLDLTTEQQKELKLLAITAESAAEDVGELFKEVDALRAAGPLTTEQISAFNERIATLQATITDTSGDMNVFLGSVQAIGGAAGTEATDVMEKLSDQIKILGIFGEEAQFVMQALAEANLDAADKANAHRQKVEALAGKVFALKQEQDAYTFAVDSTTRPLEQLEERMTALNILMDKGKISQEQFSIAVGLTKLEIEEMEESLADLERQSRKAGLTPFRQGLADASDQMGFTKENMRELGEFAATELSGALTDALKSPKDAGEILIGTLARIGDQIIELALQQFLLKPLFDTLSGINQAAGAGGGARAGGGGGGGFLGGALKVLSLFSEGGYADSPPALGVVPAGMFKNARRFQAGGAADRIPALLNRNEAVVPLTGNRAIPVEGAGGQTIVFNITTPDADSFRRAQSQILSQAASQLSRAAQRNN